MKSNGYSIIFTPLRVSVVFSKLLLDPGDRRPDVIQMDTLYYDGNCPLCLREIRLLERLQRGQLELVDAHAYEPAAGEPVRESMLYRLHLKTSDGDWLSGVDASVKAWSHTRWGFLFSVLRWPLIGPLADSAYRYWARKRYQRLYGCDRCEIE